MEAEDDVGDPLDGVKTSSPLCVVETHEMGGFSFACPKAKGNSARNVAVPSQELMAGGYERQIVRSDGESAMVSHVRLAILATMADGPCETIQEKTSKGQSPGNGLAEGPVKLVKAKIRTFCYELERCLSRSVTENHDTA